MKTKYCWFIFIIILISCNTKKNNIKTYEGKKIEITYNPFKLKNIKENDFIIIDAIKYTHKSNHTNTTNDNSLPSINNIIMQVEGKKREEKGNIVNISRALAKNLIKNNNLKLINPNKTTLFGKILIESTNKNAFKIEFNVNYPVSIKIIN